MPTMLETISKEKTKLEGQVNGLELRLAELKVKLAEAQQEAKKWRQNYEIRVKGR